MAAVGVARRGLGVAGCLAVLALAACSALGGGSDGAPAPTAGALAPDSTVTWALDQPPLQYNPNATSGDSPANAAVLSNVLGAFWRYAPDGTVQRTTEFGTYAKVADDPLTVRYTIAPRAVWSDGVAVDCDDIAMAWLANSGVTGENGFSALAVDRYREMNKPRCEAGDKVVTITYRRPVADWETAFGPGSAWLLPAHVVEREAHLAKTFVDYLDTPRSPELAPAIAFWNTGWAFTPGQVRKDVVLSSGPYLIDAWTAGQSITLRPNPRWWGTPPGTGTVVIRFMDVGQQVPALSTGKLQVIAPWADAALVKQLRAVPAGKIKAIAGYRFDLEHLDFNLKGPFADRSLREAFARCVPRQQIVDRLVKPVNPVGRILESRLVLPFQPGYGTFEPAGRAYDTVDLAGARQLLAGRRPTVRIGWRKDPEQLNQGRADTLALVKASCGQAGFSVVDAGTPTFFDREWPSGAYDVAMFSWTGSPVVSGTSDIYTTGGASNPGGFTDPQVDRLFATLAKEPDAARRLDLLRRIDALLWNDLATLPLFAYPALVATSVDVQGVTVNPTITGAGWNLGDWRRQS